MLYIVWVIGVLLAIFAAVKVTIKLESTGKFDE